MISDGASTSKELSYHMKLSNKPKRTFIEASKASDIANQCKCCEKKASRLGIGRKPRKMSIGVACTGYRVQIMTPVWAK